MKALCQKINEQQTYIKSILKKESTIYWLAYLLKKLHQFDKEVILRYKNSTKADQYDLDFRTIIKRRVSKKAEEYAEIKREILRTGKKTRLTFEEEE